MFSFRRKPKKKVQEDLPWIRTSPSLPELHSTGIPWPSNLVNLEALPSTPTVDPPLPKAPLPLKGAAKTSFSSNEGPISFHKPFWSSPGKSVDNPTTGGSISSLYMSHPPSAFDNRRTSAYNRPRPSQKRTRNPTTFNLMVAGSQGTGKTSLLRLLLETADISPTATIDQKVNVERFLKGHPKRTQSIQTACVEICESKYDRLLFSVIDTPGLDFQEGHELNLERQVSTIIKYMDTQFSDTLSEESKVVRQSKGDQHIHLCIYTVDPSSIMTVAARRALSSVPSKTRSETTVSYRPPDLSPVSDDSTTDDSSDEEDADDAWQSLSMHPADIRVIRRISKKANVLPIIARADELTNEKLRMIKKVVRRDLDAAGMDFGVFGPINDPLGTGAKDPSATNGVNGNGNHVNGDGTEKPNGHVKHPTQPQSPRDDEGDDERQSRPVIKLRGTRFFKPRQSHSRSRKELSEAANEPAAAEITDSESVASIRFSAHIVGKSNMGDMLPFALIAPEHGHHNKKTKSRTHARASSASNATATVAHSNVSISDEHHPHGGSAVTSEDGHFSGDSHHNSMVHSPPTSPSPVPSVATSRVNSYLAGPPADLKGCFVRRFRWGTVDVLNPEHCDFAALRTAILSTHMKMLKIRTKEVLYEKFRTEKLLARRATRNIGEDETKKLLEGLALPTDLNIDITIPKSP